MRAEATAVAAPPVALELDLDVFERDGRRGDGGGLSAHRRRLLENSSAA